MVLFTHTISLPSHTRKLQEMMFGKLPFVLLMVLVMVIQRVLLPQFKIRARFLSANISPQLFEDTLVECVHPSPTDIDLDLVTLHYEWHM